MVAHAGSVGLRLLADRVGLTGQLSTAMARGSFVPVHDRGQVMVDVAVMLADGGEAISDIDVLRHQDDVLGPVASTPTVWRTLDEVTPGRAKKIAAARARVRRHVWAHIPAGLPASKVAGKDLGEPSASGATTPGSSWPASCAPAGPGPTPPPTTSRC